MSQIAFYQLGNVNSIGKLTNVFKGTTSLNTKSRAQNKIFAMLEENVEKQSCLNRPGFYKRNKTSFFYFILKNI